MRGRLLLGLLLLLLLHSSLLMLLTFLRLWPVSLLLLRHLFMRSHLRVRSAWCVLINRWLRIGTMDILLLAIPLRWPTLAFAPDRYGRRTLFALRLVLLAHYGVTRLVAVVLTLDFLLLLSAGIAVSRILALIDR
jgi:hypothetical protein